MSKLFRACVLACLFVFATAGMAFASFEQGDSGEEVQAIQMKLASPPCPHRCANPLTAQVPISLRQT